MAMSKCRTTESFALQKKIIFQKITDTNLELNAIVAIESALRKLFNYIHLQMDVKDINPKIILKIQLWLES